MSTTIQNPSVPAPSLAELLKFADLQMAAEAFLVDANGTPFADARYVAALVEGNDHASRFTEIQANEFLEHWEVVAQQPNTATGFSGTLFRNKDTGELVMSFRSTEFIDDSARDNQATNALEIKETGFAWGQLRDMGCCRFQRHLVKVEDETGGGSWEREGNSAESSSLKQSSW